MLVMEARNTSASSLTRFSHERCAVRVYNEVLQRRLEQWALLDLRAGRGAQRWPRRLGTRQQVADVLNAALFESTPKNFEVDSNSASFTQAAQRSCGKHVSELAGVFSAFVAIVGLHCSRPPRRTAGWTRTTQRSCEERVSELADVFLASIANAIESTPENFVVGSNSAACSTSAAC